MMHSLVHTHTPLPDRKVAARVSCAKDEKAYQRSLLSLQNILGVRSGVSLRNLCVQFGCVGLAGAAERNFKAFCTAFRESLPPIRRDAADFSQPIYTVVVFYLTARRNKSSVDKSRLVKMAESTPSAWAKVEASVRQHVASLQDPKKKKETKAKAVQGSEDEALAGQELDLADARENPTLASSRYVCLCSAACTYFFAYREHSFPGSVFRRCKTLDYSRSHEYAPPTGGWSMNYGRAA